VPHITTPCSRSGVGHAVAQRAPEHDDDLLHREREAHGHEDVELVRLGVHAAQQQLLGQPAERAHEQRHQHQRGPEVEAPLHGLEAQVGAQQIESAVREVHEAQQAEHDGQANGQQEIQHADADSVDGLEQVDGHGRRRCPLRPQASLQPVLSTGRNDLPELTTST
jgi:hypothetical protein